jgi:hypothetical protein
MGFFGLTLGVLATWRITHLLNGEDGPAQVLVRFRRWLGTGFAGSLADCFYCLSLWVAAPVAAVLARGMVERVLAWLALSAGAILLQRLTAHPQPPRASFQAEGSATRPARYAEDPVPVPIPAPPDSGSARASGEPGGG